MERVISKMLHQQQAKNAFYMLGILWSCKTCVKLAIDFYQGFKTFVLPSFWRPSSQSQWVEEYGSWAVITGCSRGIGLCYAQELARRGLNLILIGRQLSKLQQIAQDFQSEYKIMVDIIEADFTKSTKQLSKVIKNGLEGKDIGILVNNVGVILPFPTYFNEMYEDQWQQMIQVNIGAATLMTHIVLPKLEAKKKGAIINLASVSGCSPQPLQSVYAATKAYMDFFSRGLQVEYADKGITIQTICPSYVCTSMTSFSSTLDRPSLFVPSPESFVRSAIRTLGFSSYTTGYWSHSLQNFLLPLAYMPGCIFLLNKYFRREALSTK